MTNGSVPDAFSTAAPSALAGRLLRRATHPVGVIDVRSPQERYQRATTWARQHVSQLGRWVDRYGADTPQGRDAGLVFPTRASGALAASGEVPSGPRATDTPAGHGVPDRAMSASEVFERVRSRRTASEPSHSSNAPAPPSSPAATARPAARRDVEAHVGPAMHAVPLLRARGPIISRRSSPDAVVPGADQRTERVSGTDALPLTAGPATSPRASEAGGSRGTDVAAADESSAESPSSPDGVLSPRASVALPLVSRAAPSHAPVGIQRALESDVAKPLPGAPDFPEPGSRPIRSALAAPVPRAATIQATEVSPATFPSSHVLVQRRPIEPMKTTTVTDPRTIDLTVVRRRATIPTTAPSVESGHSAPPPAPDAVSAGSESPSRDRSGAGSSHADESRQTVSAGRAASPSLATDTLTLRTSATAAERPAAFSRVPSQVVQRSVADPTPAEIVWRRAGPRIGGAAEGPMRPRRDSMQHRRP